MKIPSLDTVIKQFSDALPPPLRDMKTELEQHLRTTLEATFQKLNLVTREEFDTQTRVLAKTREKLDSLEKTLCTFIENREA